MKKVIGIVGELASGKDTAAEYLSNKLQLPIYQISDALKKLANQHNISRLDLIEYSRKITQKNGDDYLAKIIIESSSDESLILVGMRQLGQIDYLRKHTHFTLISINSPLELRFKRLITRNKSSDPSTIDELILIDKKDDGESIQKVSECMQRADYTVINNDSHKMLYEQLDYLNLK